MPIQVLSEETINKIAAGEVVERPANALKELIENALDAGSTSVDIELQGAGRRLIRVRDNGSGMSREDLLLAVTRHATGKIRSFDDLSALHTLGFRGEALPSIAAVSRMRIQSRLPGTDSGWELRLDGGTVRESTAWAGAPGTIVEVADLFYNTPARAKFLKSDATEKNRMTALIEEIALAWTPVAFSVTAEGKKVLSAPKTGARPERLADILGGDFAAALIPVEVRHPRLTLQAYVTRTEHSLPTRRCQYLFINNRPVSMSKALLHGLYEAYRENLPQGRHPGAVVFLEIDPAEVDVNVHPAKREVRFAKEHDVHDFVYRAIKEAVTGTPFVPYAITGTPGQGKEASAASGFFSSRSFRPAPGVREAAAAARFEPVQSKLFAPQEGPLSTADGAGTELLGQFLRLYLVAQHGEELLLVDQHAAAERVRYERYRAAWRERRIPVQPLLLPVTVELPASQAGLLRENLPLLKEAGWEIDEFGAKTVRITALPAVLGNDFETQAALGAVLEALSEESKLPPADRIERIIRAACRASIKAGDAVSREEASRLLKDLFSCESPYTCPHGRPTMWRMGRDELEKYFGRK